MVETLITEHIDVWTSAIKAKSSAGRGGGKKQELYGIKKLRELILELAVRGLLVPQDPNDEPASELLKKIAAEKAKLIKEGEIKKQSKLPPVQDGEHPFLLPPGWRFERLGNLTSKLGSGSTPRGGKSAYVLNGIIFLRSQNVWNDGLKLDDTAYIPEETHVAMQNTQVFPRDVLLNITGASLGRSTIFPEELITANVSQHVTIIRLIEAEMAEFLHLGILSPLVQKLVWGRQVGMAIEGLSKKVLEKFEFPIPPLAEQHRIVAKVDELMALCDHLEQQQEDSLRTHQTLVKTLLGALTTASDPGRFSGAWKMIESNFDTLFTTESSIDELKQTILQLAVMGKLVTQQGDTEDAKQDFPNWKARSTKVKSECVPSNWLNIPLGKIGEWKGGGTPSKNNSAYWDGSIPWVCPKDMKRPSISDSILQITEVALEETSVKQIPPDSLMMVVRGMILARDFPVAISGCSVTVNQDMKALIPAYKGVVSYIALVLRAFCPKVLGMVERSSHGTCKLQTKTIQSLLIPIPPLAEQHRIVAKVEELMVLCDRLKAGLQTVQTTQLHLADTLVETAIQ
jgi:type I restriction enzyme S subunit